MTRDNTPFQGWYIIFHTGEELRSPCISQDEKQAVPWDPSGGCTSGACTLSPHRSASWTGWCPTLSSCSFHQWCDRTAPHPPHCRGKRWNFESWLHEHRMCILCEVTAQVPVALATGMWVRSYFLAFFTVWVADAYVNTFSLPYVYTFNITQLKSQSPCHRWLHYSWIHVCHVTDTGDEENSRTHWDEIPVLIGSESRSSPFEFLD